MEYLGRHLLRRHARLLLLGMDAAVPDMHGEARPTVEHVLTRVRQTLAGGAGPDLLIGLATVTGRSSPFITCPMRGTQAVPPAQRMRAGGAACVPDPATPFR
ncbi:hypothetical protein ABZ722_33040 [Streptomyces longwoodensis]|uniref:hypothetical protein n=1 Tax=Streptomyces longwoodensis TaxID=68231 RepID=UPI0033F46EC2